MIHPDLWLSLHNIQYQDHLREVETWRLARTARQQRARYVGQFLHRLVSAIRLRLNLQARPKPVKPDLANLHR